MQISRLFMIYSIILAGRNHTFRIFCLVALQLDTFINKVFMGTFLKSLFGFLFPVSFMLATHKTQGKLSILINA